MAVCLDALLAGSLVAYSAHCLAVSTVELMVLNLVVTKATY